jgi:glycosyltransferase involved in cell wall biosynthesis
VRPDIAHIFGFRDAVGFGTARWCHNNSIPYVFEPLGMLLPRLRKVVLKRLLDATLFRQVVRNAGVIVATSKVERDEIVTAGVSPQRVVIRGNGFPEPLGKGPAGWLRRRLDVPLDAPLVLYVGRIAAGKGIEYLLSAARALPGVHLVIAGPDNKDGTLAAVRSAQAEAVTAQRIHVLTPADMERPFHLYPEADVFVLASASESFGMVAAEAAACGTPTIVTDRCGVAEAFSRGGAMVIPYDQHAVRNAIARVLSDANLRQRLSDEALAVAVDNSWRRTAERQEELYRLVSSGPAAGGTYNV